MIGAGKYDSETTAAREATEGKGVVLIVFDGRIGNGFSAQISTDIIPKVPAILREVAAQIENDISHQSLIAATQPTSNQ